MNKKIIISAFLLTLNLSCTSDNNIINKISIENQTIHTFNVSKEKGVTLYAKLSVNDLFNTKAISNGVKEKKFSDIKSLKVYLIKSTSAVFPLSGDPLNSSNIVYQTNINTTNPDELIIKFNNVSGSTTTFGSGNYYHVAIRAFDDTNGNGNELIKNNNGSSTAWTGTTASTNRTAVSSKTGIQIRTSDLALSSTNYFNVALNLIDGKLINSHLFVKITEGMSSRIKSYRLNLCSDPLKPVSTKILPTPVIFNISENNIVGDNYYKFEIANIPEGTYYATVEAFDNLDITGNNLVKQNNSYLQYSSPDTNSNIATSKNSITVDSNLVQSFSSGTFFEVDLNNNFYINTYVESSGSTVPEPSTITQINNPGLNTPNGIAFDNSGNIYIADTNNHRIRKVDSFGVMTTVVASLNFFNMGMFGGDGGQATDAYLNTPTGVAFDNSGNMYISDSYNHRIRKVDTSGVITTVAGSSDVASFSGDGGQATDAKLSIPSGIAFDNSGNMYISDTSNHRIRKVDLSGIITTVAGSSSTGSFGGDTGQATSSNLNNPNGIAFDNSGNMYISDTSNHRIRKVDTSGIITTVAGSSSTGSFGGDGGQATDAYLNTPTGVAFDNSGNMYISDSANHRIRKVDSSGIITTVAGNGTASFSGDTGIATLATFNSPSSIAFDNLGKIYISDTLNHRVRNLN